MKIRLIKSCNYYAHPFMFSPGNQIEDVSEELSDHLLKTGYFEEVIDDSEKKLETEQEKEENASKSKKQYEDSKKVKKDK